VFGDGTADAPTATALNPRNGNVTNAGTQPLANFKPSTGTVPAWCPYQVSTNTCETVNPFGRLHGGVPNSTAYQMWISAVGLQPQDNTFFVHTYPWLGFRIGYIG
jgi:hypothetical protein